MKTKSNSKPHETAKGGHGGNQTQKTKNHHGQGKRKDKFFLDHSKPEKTQRHGQPDGGPPGKKGPGVKKTVSFKPNHGARHDKGRNQIGKGNKNNGRPQNGPHKGPQKGPHKWPQKGPYKGSQIGPHKGPHKGPNKGPNKGPHKGPKKGPQPGTPATEHVFHSKPEKVNYCLAPERLDAQARAIKQFERKEREQEQEQKKLDRNMKHKMMTQKTRKGQPVMQGRLELLYERVKKVVGVQ